MDEFPLVTARVVGLTGQLEEIMFTLETKNESHAQEGKVYADEQSRNMLRRSLCNVREKYTVFRHSIGNRFMMTR